MGIPELNRDESLDKAKQTSRNLIPWLEDPYTCDCGELCYAEQAYVESQADYMDVWQCPDCSSMYHRTRD